MANYTENTFKNSKWTLFHQGAAGGKKLTPYDFIAVQAPRGVAEDVVRKAFGVDPNYVHCQHCGTDYNVSESEDLNWLWNFSSHVSLMVIRHDAIPYFAKGIWNMPKWEEIEEK